jgi:hypothetical protein
VTAVIFRSNPDQSEWDRRLEPPLTAELVFMNDDRRLQGQTERSRQPQSGDTGRVSHEMTTNNGDDAPSADREAGTDEQKEDSKKPVAWKDLPRKDQLIIITLARLSEPIVQTSLQVRRALP